MNSLFRRTLVLLAISPLLAAFHCGGDDGPAASLQGYSVTIQSINESDISGGVLAKDENVSNGSGNPWGDMIARGRDACGGERPQRFVFRALRVGLAASKDVSGFEDLVSGELSVRLLDTRGSDATALKVTLGSLTQPTGAAPLDVPVTASTEALAALADRLAGGDFHIGVTAQTSRRDDKEFSVDISVSFDVEAFCQ